jgi:hypothetical protein
MPLGPLLLFAVTIALLLLPGRPAESQDRLAIISVSIVDVAHGSVHRDQTVLVEGDRIAVVGDAYAVEVPAGTVVIDGNGKFLIPGLWDMHVHTGSDQNTREVVYPLLEASSTFAGSYGQAARRSTEGSSPEAPGTEADARVFVQLVKERGVDFIKVYDMLPREAYFALASEATRVGLPFAGHVPVKVRASEASDAGQRSIEHIGMGNVLEECSSREDELRPRVIAELQSDQPDLLPLLLEMVDTHDTRKCAALADRFARNGTWVVPTLMLARLPSELERGWREDPYARFLAPQERRYIERGEELRARELGEAEQLAPVDRWIREVTRAMHRVGVPMLAGPDAGVSGIFWGIGLHRELELLVSAGLTEPEALRAATLGPAEFLEATDSLGTVEPGKVADLVLLEANPLEDISNTQRIAAVVLNGGYFDRNALDAMLAYAEQAASRPPASARELLDPEDGPLGEEVQEPEISRTRTFPGLEDAPYPYVTPAEVGLSAEYLEKLGDKVTGWVRDKSGYNR